MILDGMSDSRRCRVGWMYGCDEWGMAFARSVVCHGGLVWLAVVGCRIVKSLLLVLCRGCILHNVLPYKSRSLIPWILGDLQTGFGVDRIAGLAGSFGDVTCMPQASSR